MAEEDGGRGRQQSDVQVHTGSTQANKCRALPYRGVAVTRLGIGELGSQPAAAMCHATR